MTPKALKPQKSDVSLKDLYRLDEVLDKYGEKQKKSSSVAQEKAEDKKPEE
jgi:hypothetical protein